MRYATFLIIASMLIPLGCKKQGPKTTAIEAPPRHVDTLAPAEPVKTVDKDRQVKPTPDNEKAEPKKLDVPAGPVDYTIQKGDTLWSIAKKHLGDGKRWKDIVAANPGLKPEKLKVGQKIVIPPK